MKIYNLLDITSLDDAFAIFRDWVTTQGVKIVFALVIGVIGFAVVNMVVGWIKKINIKRNFDKTLGITLRKVIGYSLKILILVALLSYLGVDTSGMTALIASLGITIGLALQGALSNVAGGILIIIARPFVLDDFIEAQGVSGTVEDIRLLYMTIRTFDNRIISLPNGTLANGTIINYSAKTTRRVDLKFSISYEDDFKRAEEIILDIAANHELVLKDPPPKCRITSHGESAIVLFSAFWCKTEDYWTVYFDMNERVKAAFDEKGVTIPFNQLDIHIKDGKE
ncbi:MAG: mechanosensitive ion channel [Clostridia bacterium]|nr:mechanosensitive ion channel [Clostridia bacterium]